MPKDDSFSVEKSIEDERAKVVDAITKLPSEYYDLIILKYSQGCNEAEIADILGISKNNVKNGIAKAKKKLEEMVNQE